MQSFRYQISRFLLVGGLSTSLNYSVFLSLVYLLHFHYLASNVLGYLSGLIVGYLLNRNWTFAAHKATARQHYEIVLYFIMNAVSLTLSLTTLHFVVSWFSVPAWFGNLIAISVSTVSNFIGLKFIVFKPKSEQAL